MVNKAGREVDIYRSNSNGSEGTEGATQVKA
jgi:hypothetical protein